MPFGEMLALAVTCCRRLKSSTIGSMIPSSSDIYGNMLSNKDITVLKQNMNNGWNAAHILNLTGFSDPQGEIMSATPHALDLKNTALLVMDF